MEKIRLQILLNEDKHLGEKEVVKMAIELLAQMQQFQEMQPRFYLLTPNTITVILNPSACHYSYELSGEVELLNGDQCFTDLGWMMRCQRSRMVL